MIDWDFLASDKFMAYGLILFHFAISLLSFSILYFLKKMGLHNASMCVIFYLASILLAKYDLVA